MPILYALILAVVAAGRPAPALQEHAAWMSCLTDYAQGESAGNKTPATIAVEALSTCRPQRAAYWRKLVQNGADITAVDDQVATEEHDAGRMIIAFVTGAR